MDHRDSDGKPTVGILYSGEMGSTLGRVFLDAGLRTVTTLEDRSPRTERFCREVGLEVLPSFREVVRVANIVVSVVPPSAAVKVARDYTQERSQDCSPLAPRPSPLFIDANAISPATVVEVGKALAGAGVDYVDVAINGMASVLRTDAIVYLSGIRAGEIAQMLEPFLRVQVVGDVPGKASALKGALAGLSKGITALFVEIAVMAREAGVSEFFMERCRSYYPGLTEVVDRMLPSYPRHARRRAEEMKELEDAMLALGLQPNMVHAAAQVTRAIADAHLKEGTAKWTADGVLEALQHCGALRRTDN
jgi:3-hydroxyisobutyrate dehydrogenase-like beta-hydroxyacid dehydrogenase